MNGSSRLGGHEGNSKTMCLGNTGCRSVGRPIAPTARFGAHRLRSCRRTVAPGGLALAVGMLLAVSSPSAAEVDAVDEEHRLPRWFDWSPSIATAFGVYFVDYIADVESNIRPSGEGSDYLITPFVDFVFELMSPELEMPLRPGFFVQASVGPSFGQDVIVASEGALGDLVFPDFPFYGQGAIQGLGSETTIEAQSPTYGARIGVALSLPIFERIVRLKPSVGWSRQGYRASGEVLQVFRQGFAGPNTIVRLKGAETRTYDSIGPGLEIEADLEQRSRFGISAFLYSYAHYNLHDRNGSFTAADEQDHSARFGYKTDAPWVYRLGAGVRLRWLGP